MLMNGKEVNNLIVNGDVYTKANFVGKRAKAKSPSHALSPVIDPKTGDIVIGMGIVWSLDAAIWVIVAQYKQTNNVYVVEENPSEYSTLGGWISIDYLEILDDEVKK